MAEEDNSNAYSSSGSSGNDFYLLSEDDIAGTGDLAIESEDASEKHHPHQSAATAAESSKVFGISAPVDVEAIKQKAEELAKSLQKALSTVSKSASSSSRLENIEIRDDLKQHRERSLYVEQKLKEDRKLFEESKKRSEAVFDKVQSVKRIQESISENVREMNRKETDDSHSLKLKIQSLEDTISRLQESLSNKNRIISEKNEQIRSLNQSVSDTHDAYMHSLEQSELEIDQVKNEYKKKIEEVFSSKEELFNQLQLVRKNYLTVENDLKLSDFARSQLVNRNAELQEKILALERDNERLSAKLGDESGRVEPTRNSEADIIDEIRPKIENLIIITNEFSTFLSDDLDDIEELSVDEEDVCQSVDSIGDKLEAAFYTMRDKLSSVPKLQSKLEKMNKELQQMETLLRQNEQHIASLQQQLSATQTKLDAEIRENAQLAESIRDTESWQGVSQNPPTPSQPRNRDSDSSEENLQLDQLKRECLHLNVELESKSNEIQMLASNIDELNETIKKLRLERQQLCQQMDEKSNECEHIKRSHEEVCDQLESLRQESSEQCQQMTHEYQLLQQTCRELQSKCDYLDEELQVTVQQVEKLRAQHSDEQLEKEENDFVVLQTRDCDEEDSLKRRCMHLKDENEKLVATVRTMSEKAIEYENERLTLEKYVNECSRLQEAVKRLSQELEATKKQLYQASVASRETEDDKDDEIESLQEEMAKLEQQLSKVWDQLHNEKTHNHQLSEQLGSCERANASISQQMQQQNAELEFLRKSNAELMQKLESLSESSNSDEVIALREHGFQLQKMLDIAHHDHQTTKNELQVAQTSLAQLQTVVDEFDHLKGKNNDLQAEISKLLQKCQTLEESYNEASKLLAVRDAELNKTTAEAQRSFQELHETLTALHEAQCDIQFARNEKEAASRCLEEYQIQAGQTRAQLEATQKELQTVIAQLHESENSVHDWMEKYDRDLENFQKNIATLNSDNAALKQQCEAYRTNYNNLQMHVSQIVSAASRTSDDAINIVHRLQSQWPLPKPVVHAEMQCSAELEADVRLEVETYKLLLNDMREELSTLKNHYEKVQQELLEKRNEMEKFEINETRMNDALSEVEYRLDLTERALSEKKEDLQKQAREFEQRLQSSEADHLNKLQCYQNQIQQLEQKLTETRKPEVLEAGVQVSTLERHEKSQTSSDEQKPSFADIDLGTTQDFFDTHTHQTEQDGSSLTDIQPGTNNEGPGLMKYFGYYREKMTKGLTEMLNPEEQAVDYSNWILPDQPIVKRQLIPESVPTPLVTEVVQTSTPPTPQVSIPSSAPPLPRLFVSDILDKLQNTISAQMNDGGWDVDEDNEWSCNQLQLQDPEFVNTAFKFVDLFDIVVQYYSSLPATDAVLEKLGSVAATAKPPSTTSDLPAASELPEAFVAKAVDTSKETIEQVVTLATLLENENKHLVDAITFLEETIASVRPSEDICFQSVIEYWHNRITIDDDLIDRVCEEYDIVPAKFVPGDQLVQWKEQMARCMEMILKPVPALAPILPAPTVQAVCPLPVAENLQLLKKKVHKLICDLHYVYKDESTFNPADFFAQIEDINHAVEATAKMASSKEEKVGGPADVPSGGLEQHPEYGHEDNLDHHDHSHHDHDHSHHTHEPDHGIHSHDHEHGVHSHDHDHDVHSHDHGHHVHHVHSHDHGHHVHDHTSHHHDSNHPVSVEEHDQRDTVADLKALLGESNKKIDSLVKELMEVKSSREYNEVRQLHTKLDETLYQLHLRDVHVVELTRELTQLLAERDSLQLKLSNIIRQNEHLREIAVSNAASGTVMQLPDLENKLEELQGVNYMKDPRISEASKKYHVTGMQLYHEEQRSREEPSTSIVPSILKWFTGDTETK